MFLQACVANLKKYVTEGFGNYFCSEAVPGALPARGNNPQKCAYGLYAEQLSGTAFTVDRHNNQRTWVHFYSFTATIKLMVPVDGCIVFDHQLNMTDLHQ